MPNIAALLKSEIARVARKEIRAELGSLREATGTYRSEVAELKRRLQALEEELRRVVKAARTAAPPPDAPEESGSEARFSAKGLASHRKRLGLSAADAGMLVGSSGLSIYKWERGDARPRVKYLPALVAFRSLGKKEAAARLNALK